MTYFKPAPSHNPLKAAGACMCVSCCRIVTALRCTATDPEGHRCGDYASHRGSHTRLVCTTFEIADERIAAAEDQTP